MITGAEAATVAKAGVSIAQGIKTALAHPEAKWPNAREALMELLIILDDWCQSAEETNAAAQEALHRARLQAAGIPTPNRAVFGPGFSPGPAIPGYVENAARDIKNVLDPSVPWPKRWRRSASRAAARRTLRSMLRIYCPDLDLGFFDAAVANRAAWVTEHRSRWPEQPGPDHTPECIPTLEEWVANLTREADALAALEDPHTIAEEREMANRMESTLRDLQEARNGIRELIEEKYPTLPG
jgi:hypothetical protein